MYLEKYKKQIIAVICFVLVAIPFVFRRNLYYLGGDDMRLYYVYPDKYLQNYVFNIVSDNTLAGAMTGFTTVAYLAPLYMFFNLLKLIPINTQSLLFGLNISLGFYFFYKLLSVYIKKSQNRFIVLIVSSLFYVFSPLYLVTLFKTQLLYMYLLSVLPAFLYFFVRSIREKSLGLLLTSILIINIFSGTVANLPWLAASVIPILIFLIPEFIKNKKVFIKYSLVFVFISILLNLYWLGYFIDSTLNGVYTTQEFIGENIRVASGVSAMFSPRSQIFLALISSRSIDFLSSLNIIFILIILFGVFVNRSRNFNTNIYVLSAFLVSWYLFNPNIGKWGSELFVNLTKTIPFWGMFRNMFDKFALVFSFFYAFVFAIAFTNLSKHLNKKVFYIISALLVVLLTIQYKQFFTDGLTIDDSNKLVSGKFDSNYSDLQTFLSDQNISGNVLWLPLNGPTYSSIEDARLKNRYYSGLPLGRVLYDRDELVGRFSFIHQYDWFAGDKIVEYIRNGQIDKAAEEIARYDIDYIVDVDQILPPHIEDFMFGSLEEGYFVNTDRLLAELSGEEIKTFGDKYTLFSIDEKYKKNFAESNDVNLTTEKISSEEYLIRSDENVKLDYLTLNIPFSEKWKVYIKSNGNTTEANIKEFQVYDSWATKIIFETPVELSSGGRLMLFFEPTKYKILFTLISFTTYILVFLTIVKYSIKNTKQNEK